MIILFLQFSHDASLSHITGHSFHAEGIIINILFLDNEGREGRDEEVTYKQNE